jgi:hypothetical protein
MRVFKNAWFVKFARKAHIRDEELLSAVRRAQDGLIDADLGGEVIKQRIARQGQGKSSGYRSLILFRKGSRAVFAFAFAKNVQANIGAADERDLKAAAKIVLSLSDAEMDELVRRKVMQEVKDHEQG